MTIQHQTIQPSFKDTVLSYLPVDLGARHAGLDAAYKADAGHALVVDEAVTTSAFVPGTTALYSQVTLGHYDLPPIDIGVHEKVGGNHDFPNPGELLCAAIAACFDSCIRLICCRLGVDLKALSVQVRGHVDVRGTLKMAQGVPVGFQSFTIDVDIDGGNVPEQTIAAILKAGEESCVVMQTIKHSPPIEISYHSNG